MDGQGEATKVYTVRVRQTGQDFSFGVPYGEDPPPRIRLYHGNSNSSIAVFSFNKRSDSYIELSNDELEKFDGSLKSGGCRHSDSVNRERGDERFDKQLARLQKRLKERNNGDQCSYCQQFAGVVHIDVGPSSSVTAGILITIH
jgi:hypothetical protein